LVSPFGFEQINLICFQTEIRLVAAILFLELNRFRREDKKLDISGEDGETTLERVYKSLFESQIDPDKEEQFHGAKMEIENKVKRILKLIKDDNLENDGTPAEILKREPLALFIEDFHNKY
jgi:hypothetical protein